MHVASVYFKCFRCFIGMLQVFHKDVANKGISGCYTCCIGLYTYVSSVYVPNVSSVSDVCCKYFIWMLQN
jgi:hypothetical protein